MVGERRGMGEWGEGGGRRGEGLRNGEEGEGDG